MSKAHRCESGMKSRSGSGGGCRSRLASLSERPTCACTSSTAASANCLGRESAWLRISNRTQGCSLLCMHQAVMAQRALVSLERIWLQVHLVLVGAWAGQHPVT